jgi:transglutaminase-like putative cysteine protease
MTRASAVFGALLVLLGLSAFAVKALHYRIPLAPTEALGPWQVELRVSVRGEGRRGSVRALLPFSADSQIVFDERASSDRLAFSIRDGDGERTGVWSGWLRDIHEIVYEFRVQIFSAQAPVSGDTRAEVPAALMRQYTAPTPDYPANAAEVAEILEFLRLPRPDNRPARVRTIYAFVTHEVATVRSAGRDALLTLTQREGSAEGKERLLVTLLRAAGIPARAVRGLELREGTAPEERIWSEAYVGDAWVPMSTTGDFFGIRPASFLVLGPGERPLVEATGVRAVGHRFRAMREQLRPDEIASLLAPDTPILAWTSLYRLPLPTQHGLRILLLLPLGALVVALFRNVVGVTTYGTFMPVLIALALREFALSHGLALVAFVLLVGVLGRLALERLRLLMVPRLSILMCLVVLSVAALALVGRDTGSRDFFAGVVFPIVILTMLIERISITIAEEGTREALMRALYSVLVAVAVYPIFRSGRAEYLMFSFPELVIVVMGLLVWIGGYMGYRLSDLLRFRALMAGAEAR